jgi:glycosyltransferase involved in cell wall biosynthesis
LTSQLKLLILVNWKEDGKWPLLHALAKRVRSVDVLQPFSFKTNFGGRLTYASNYLSEFYTPVMALLKKTDHDVVISWQMRIGVCYGILKRLFHRGKPPVHIIQDFHIDLSKTNWFYRLQIALLKWALPGIDYFCCTSTEEEEIYSRMFGIPRNRIVFLPLVESPKTFEEPAQPRQDYIFSYGKSDRDFDTLVRAVAPLNIQTDILCKNYEPQVPLPENVSVIRTFISDREMVQKIAASRMVVLPLKDYRVSAGQLSMLEVMALARPLIITENMATREYAAHGETALFFQAGDDKELQEHIAYLWHHSEMAEQIGRRARQAALKLHAMRMAVFCGLLEHCATDIHKGERR